MVNHDASRRKRGYVSSSSLTILHSFSFSGIRFDNIKTFYNQHFFCIAFVGEGNYQNLQVSSRTDRGVHALKNTIHVDLRERSSGLREITSTKNNITLHPLTIQHALNFHLRSPKIRTKGRTTTKSVTSHPFPNSSTRTATYGANDIRVLRVVPAPLQHTYYYQAQGCNSPSSYPTTDGGIPPHYTGEWNARFTATQRRYVYRILTGYNADQSFRTLVPFEWDRSWLISRNGSAKELDISLMREAATYLIGTHDFTSFRGKNCQRSSPITTISELTINENNDYFPLSYLGYSSSSASQEQNSHPSLRLITISVAGTSFLYRQVRNMVGCLVYAGQGRISPLEVQRILHDKNRNIAPPTAPAHALFLVDVKHEGLNI